jgi:hypothetical protein
MSRLTFTAVAAAVALMAASAAPAQAMTPLAGPAVLKSDGPTANLQRVDERHWWKDARRGRHGDRDNFRFGFGFGAGPPVFYPYAYRTYPRYDCPYGYRYEPGYGCVAFHPRHGYPRYSPGVSFEFRL